MPVRRLVYVLGLTAVVTAATAGEPGTAPASVGDQGIGSRVLDALDGLGAASAAERDTAERLLDGLGRGADAPAVLATLPTPDDSLPPEVRAAVERVRLRIERGLARRATEPSRITLHAQRMPLADALAEFGHQTGAQLVDSREAFGGDPAPREVTVRIDNEPFWQGLDRLLGAARLAIYPFGDAGVITLVNRDPTAAAATPGRIAYAGPFRFEAVSLAATRGLRDPAESRLDLAVQVAWEPRLRPIAMSQPMAALEVIDETGRELSPRTPEQTIEMEATSGEQLLEMFVSLAPPSPRAARLESVGGTLTAIVPAQRREFRFQRLVAAKAQITQTFGDASVQVDRFTEQNGIWELHMRVRLARAGDALASHRGWVFENPSYLLTPDGARIDHAGLETTLQTDDQIGMVYLFDPAPPDAGDAADDDAPGAAPGEAPAEPSPTFDPATVTWVYETPTGVYTVPVSWKLGPIDAP